METFPSPFTLNLVLGRPPMLPDVLKGEDLLLLAWYFGNLLMGGEVWIGITSSSSSNVQCPTAVYFLLLFLLLPLPIHHTRRSRRDLPLRLLFSRLLPPAHPRWRNLLVSKCDDADGAKMNVQLIRPRPISFMTSFFLLPLPLFLSTFTFY